MQPLHLLRVFFGLSLRLGLSGVFLLSSASLAVAASLLLYTASEGVGERRAWQAPADTSATTFEVRQDPERTARLTPRISLGPAAPLRYSFSEPFTSRSPTAGPVPNWLLASTTAIEQPFPTPFDAAKATVQRSWATIKSAFR